jgi:hypothetical protein
MVDALSHADERDPMSTLTSEAKAKLAQTVRTLRERLLIDLHNAADSAYRLALPLAQAGLDEEHRVKRQRMKDAVLLEVLRLQFDGLGVVLESFGCRAAVSVMVSQVVPGCGVSRFELPRFLPIILLQTHVD